MQMNTTYAHNSGSSLPPMLYPVAAPAATRGMLIEKESAENKPGFIFLCNGETKPECYRYRVFGLPQGKLDVAENIKPGTMLFLYDFSVKRLYGIYAAISRGGMNLEPAAFHGKFPAQVRFRIVSDCFPLAGSALKHVIKDNYQGSKFRQELSTEQVKALVSLFRPIDMPPSAFVVPMVSNVAPAHLFASATEVEKVLPPTRSHLLYPSGANHAHAWPQGCVQPSTHLPYVVQQPTLSHQSNHYYSAEAHPPFFPENSVVSSYDPDTSYEAAIAMGSRNHIPRHENQYHVPQLPKERDTDLHLDNVANYYGQYQPSATTPHGSLQAQGLGPSYALPLSSSTQQQLQLIYQSYYAQLTHNNQSLAYAYHPQGSTLGTSSAVKEHLPVSAQYPFAGAASTYQQ